MNAFKGANRQGRYWAFVMPSLLFVLLFSILPLLFNFYYALFSWNGISSTKLFVGFQNFRDMVSDVTFKRSVSFTSRYMLISVVITNTLALWIAVVLSNAKKTLSNIGRAAYYIPCITSSAASGLMWKFIFRNGTKSIFAATGWAIFGKSWIGSVDMSFYAILLVGIWGSLGFYNIIYIAALLAVPADILEAARIDGANEWKRFWHVTFPQIFPTFSICVLLSLINGFKVFDPILLITDGGPAGMTTSMAFDIYNTAFSRSAYGMASAKALVFFAALIVLTVIELTMTKKVDK
jgi:raffinose/stachyose/melibiose transport system permease protein